VLRRTAFLVFAQGVGFTLDEISAELAELPQDRAPKEEDWAKLSTGWTARVEPGIGQPERVSNDGFANPNPTQNTKALNLFAAT
jgi:MerR family redox-sensitive transcriptional activator SoxR